MFRGNYHVFVLLRSALCWNSFMTKLYYSDSLYPLLICSSYFQPTRDPNWYKAKNERGEEGMVPANYIIKRSVIVQICCTDSSPLCTVVSQRRMIGNNWNRIDVIVNPTVSLLIDAITATTFVVYFSEILECQPWVESFNVCLI